MRDRGSPSAYRGDRGRARGRRARAAALLEALAAEHGDTRSRLRRAREAPPSARRPAGERLGAFRARRRSRTSSSALRARRLASPSGAAVLARGGAAARRAARAAGGDDAAGPLLALAGERAEAQAAAREIEQLLASGEARPRRSASSPAPASARAGWWRRRSRSAASHSGSPGAARSSSAPRSATRSPGCACSPTPTTPPRSSGPDPAAGRAALGRPRALHADRAPAQARHGLGARGGDREPAAPPEARDRIQAFLKLYRAAAGGMEEMRADVFVRRLIERIGLRRQQLFAASPETAERLVSLSRLGDLAAALARREPRSSTRDFVRYVAAVAEAGELGDEPAARRPARSCSPSPSRSRASSSTTSTCSTCDAASLGRPARAEGPRGAARTLRWRGRAGRASPRARLRRDDPRPPPAGALLAEQRPGGGAPARHVRGGARGARRGARRSTRRSSSVRPRGCTRPTGWFATRCSRRRGGPGARSARCGSTSPRTSTARWRASSSWSSSRRSCSAPPRSRPTDAIEAVNQLLAQAATPEQRAALEASALDDYLLEGERERGAAPRARRRPPGAVAGGVHPAPRRRPRALGVGHRPLPDVPAQVQVRARLRDPRGADDQPALRDPHPPRARALPLGRARGRAVRRAAAGPRPAAALFEAGWRRTGFGSSDDELQYRDRAVAALRPLLGARNARAGEPGLARARLRVRDRPPPAARPRRPRRPARRRRATS